MLDAGLLEELEARLERVSAELVGRLAQEVCEGREVCNGLSGQANRAMESALVNPADLEAASTPGEIGIKR